MAAPKSVSAVVSAFSKSLVISFISKSCFIRVPGTEVQVFQAEENSQSQTRTMDGASNIRDFSLFWFPRKEPGVVHACQQHAENPIAEWISFMKAKYKPKNTD